MCSLPDQIMRHRRKSGWQEAGEQMQAGMSTACEAMAARHLGMEVCGISCITNLAAGMSKQALSHKEVQETADKVSVRFKELITELIQAI